jgi:hypothetical protein
MKSKFQIGLEERVDGKEERVEAQELINEIFVLSMHRRHSNVQENFFRIFSTIPNHVGNPNQQVGVNVKW